MTISIANHLTAEHRLEVYDLWQSELGDVWPINQSVFDEIVFSKNSVNYLARENGKLAGILSTQITNDTGSIVCIVVDKSRQRQGIGTQLLNRAIENLTLKGVRQIHLGSGGSTYFWPGIPANLENAKKFFEKRDWLYTHTSVDMILRLESFKSPDSIFENIDRQGITLKLLPENEVENLLTFEKHSFPEWHQYFARAVDTGRLNDILIAVSANEDILGSVLIEGKSPKWNCLLGDKVAEIGALGVLVEARNQGIGIALAAKGTQILKDTDFEVAFLGWTWLIDWYGKLGYKVWCEYWMGSKSLS